MMAMVRGVARLPALLHTHTHTAWLRRRQLHFPEDHKAAVYVPFLVPVFIPILVAMVKALKEKQRQTSATHASSS